MNALVSEAVTQAAGWTLIHTLWQGAAIAAVAAAAAKGCGVRNANANYVVYVAALLALAVLGLGTFARQWQSTRGAETIQPVPTIPMAEAGAVSVAPETIVPKISQGFDLERMFPAMVGVWAVGVVLMCGRLLGAGLWIRRLRRSAARWEEDRWQQSFNDFCGKLKLRRPVMLCTTLLSDVPAVVGHFKPLVLLPAAIIAKLTPEQLEAVILHELMHVKRKDYLVNLAQIFCETVLFFNPAVWWLSRQIRLERELCCDQMVAQFRGNRLEYAKALVRLEELRLDGGAALAQAITGSSLKTRILRLLSPEGPRFSFSAWTGAAGLLLAVILGGASMWPRTIAAESKADLLELRQVVETGSADSETLPAKDPSRGPREFVVSKKALLGSRHFASTAVVEDPLTKKPEIEVQLTREGAELFSRVTRENIDRQIAIVYQGKVYSAPRINEPITGGRLRISGSFTPDEARELADKLQPSPKKGAWTPSGNEDVDKVLREAVEAKRSRRYEEALARHVWYHTASRQAPAQGGVRLSFAMSYWLELGQAYPPALAKMKEVRDETAETVRTAKNADVFTLFHEYMAFNRTLQDEAKTADLFRWLDENNPAAARIVFGVAKPSLIAAGELKLCEKYVDARSFDTSLRSFTTLKERSAPNDEVARISANQFRNETATTIAFLVRKGDRPSAEKIAERALAASDDPELRKAVIRALAGALEGAPEIPANDDTAEEQELVEKEIALTKGALATLQKAREVGRAVPEQLLDQQTAIHRLEYELALLKKDSAGMLKALENEIATIEERLKIQKRKVQAGADSIDSVVVIERELLRTQRDLAAAKKGRASERQRR